MPQTTSGPASPRLALGPDGETIDLKNRALAASLAWLIPGLGHWYQGRRAKAVLFFVCIVSTFFWGFYLGEGRVVYAQWTPYDQRWQFFCQAGVGAAAIPGMVQCARFRDENASVVFAQQHMGRRGPAPAGELKSSLHRDRLIDRLMVPPVAWDDQNQDMADELDDLHKHLHRYFDLGTLFTMVAGLLNILVVFDAWAGPVWTEAHPPNKQPAGGDDSSGGNPQGAS